MIANAKVQSVLKNKKTGELWLLIQRTNLGFYIINLNTNYNPTPLLMLLPRDYSNWEEVKENVSVNI